MKNVFFIYLIISSFVINAQEKKNWDYPIKPGTEEWKKLDSNKAKVNACQIPEDILSTISTKDLLDICLQYPLLYDIYAFNSLTDGCNKLFKDFNGIRELFQRKNATLILLSHYINELQRNTLLNSITTDLVKGEYIILISTLEVLICQAELQDSIPKEEKIAILRSLVQGYEKKLELSSYFQGLGFRTNLYSRTYVISKMNDPNVKLSENMETLLFSGIADASQIDEIDKLSYQIIKN